MSRWLRTAAALLVAAAIAAPALAQTLTGSITGTVKDQQGAVLPGVTVTLTGKMGAQTQVTDATGTYRFPALEPGTYDVAADLSGFGPAKQTNLEITPGKTLTMDLALTVAGRSENITVLGESPIVDVRSSATENTVSQTLLYAAPISRLNAATGLLNYLPGVNNQSAYGGEAARATRC